MTVVEQAPDALSARVRIDSRGRVLLPARLLDAAGIAHDVQLVVWADGPGRVVLESPQLALAGVQEAVWHGEAALVEQDQRA